MSRMRQELVQCHVGDAAIERGDMVRQRYCLPPEFVGFCGHFPDYPIVPAVVQIFMAQLVAEQHLGICLPIRGVERAKFHRQLKPLDVVDVQCQRKEIRGKIIVDAQLFVAQDQVASFWLLLDTDSAEREG